MAKLAQFDWKAVRITYSNGLQVNKTRARIGARWGAIPLNNDNILTGNFSDLNFRCARCRRRLTPEERQTFYIICESCDSVLEHRLKKMAARRKLFAAKARKELKL